MTVAESRTIVQQAPPTVAGETTILKSFAQPSRSTTPPGPRLQVKSAPPHDLHRFGAARFHRSMGPAVGLVKMVENRVPRRTAPFTSGSEACLGRQLNSTPDLHHLCRKAEIHDDGLEAAACLGGHVSYANISRPSSGLLKTCPGNSSALKKRMQLSKISTETSLSSVDLDSSSMKVKVPPLSCVSTETVSPTALKSSEVPRWCLTGSSSQEILPGTHSMQIDESLKHSPTVAANFPTLHGGTSPQHWRRAQKRSLTHGSAYSSRMRAISLM
mmetsp:Transcript_85547/g.133687  ORF Transcript_85547/g.133687 Transcript_85547/m.133687 type:complete len:272 (-) Transcript_85547:517-1332(-)